MRGRSLLLLILSATLVACGVGPTPSPSKFVPAPSATPGAASPSSPVLRSLVSPIPLGLATSPSGSVAGDALAAGTLAGSVRDGTACFWLQSSATGPASTSAALVWPFGFGVESEPLRIIGPDGQIVAQAGDLVELGGGGPPVGYAPTAAQDPCGLGSIFVVSEVGSVNGTPSGVGEGSLKLETRDSGTPAICPPAVLEPLMLVMSNAHLMLRNVGSGQDDDVSWPHGFNARAGTRITILDDKGSLVMTQGDARADVRGLRSLDGTIEVCGMGPDAYP